MSGVLPGKGRKSWGWADDKEAGASASIWVCAEIQGFAQEKCCGITPGRRAHVSGIIGFLLPALPGKIWDIGDGPTIILMSFE